MKKGTSIVVYTVNGGCYTGEYAGKSGNTKNKTYLKLTKGTQHFSDGKKVDYSNISIKEQNIIKISEEIVDTNELSMQEKEKIHRRKG